MSSLSTAISDGTISSDPNPLLQPTVQYEAVEYPIPHGYASTAATIPLSSMVPAGLPAMGGALQGMPSLGLGDDDMERFDSSVRVYADAERISSDQHALHRRTPGLSSGHPTEVDGRRSTAVSQHHHQPSTSSAGGAAHQSAVISSLSSSSSSSSSPPVSSRIATIQRAFDIFTHVDEQHNGQLNADQVYRALSLFDPHIRFSREEVEHIIDVATASRVYHHHQQQQQQQQQGHVASTSTSTSTSTSLPPTLQDRSIKFSEFYAIFACYTLMQNKFGSNTTFLTRSQVSSALLEAGLDPSANNLQHMFNVKASGAQLLDADTIAASGSDDDDDEARIGFSQLLRIYMHAPRSEGDLFLHSWYKAGRTNFLQHRKHIEATPPQDFVAGTMAGVALTLVGHPWDTIKVRLQTSQRFTGVANCISETFRKEGIFGFYKGMGGPMLTIPLINAIVFTAYGQAQRFLCGGAPTKQLTLTQITLAGMYAGLVNCIVACPVELIKTRLQIQYNANSRSFDGPIDCIRQILKTSGIKGLFRGMSATIYREIPGYGGQFFMYEAIKRLFLKRGNREEFELNTWEQLISGGSAGTFGWVCSYPMDYIKSAIQSEKWNVKTKFKKHPILLDGGFFSALQMTIKQKGARELWKGFSACMIRGFPANAAGFFAYEETLKLMRKHRLFLDVPVKNVTI